MSAEDTFELEVKKLMETLEEIDSKLRNARHELKIINEENQYLKLLIKEQIENVIFIQSKYCTPSTEEEKEENN